MTDARKALESAREANPDFWAVHSATGMHVGLWADKDLAENVLREYEGGTLTPLFRTLASDEGWRTDDPATIVYGRMLHRHMKAARKDFHGPDRSRIYSLIEAFAAEFPIECKVWDDRYDPAPPAPETRT